MSDVTVSIKMSAKQAGALYVKSMNQEKSIKLLEAERDALAAKVEVLQREFKDARQALQNIAGCTWDSGAEEIADVALDEAKRWVSRYDDSALKLTPQRCLAEIKAQAGRAGFIAGVEKWSNGRTVHNAALMISDAEEYAESIRKGGAA